MTSVSDAQWSVLVLAGDDDDLASGLAGMKSVDVAEITPDEIDDSIDSYPIIATGNTLQSTIEDPAGLLEKVVSAGGFLLLLPPIGNIERELQQGLSIKSSGALLKSDRGTSVTVYRALREASGREEFQVASSNHIRVSGTTVLGRNENGQPVIVDHRLSSSGGSVLVSTAELQRQSLQTREKDRKQLLEGLFIIGSERLSGGSAEDSTEKETSDDKNDIDPFVVDRVLIALATMPRGHRELRQETINDVLPAHLEVELTPEGWGALREQLRTEGILSTDDSIDEKAVHQAVTSRDLESFVRRLG